MVVTGAALGRRRLGDTPAHDRLGAGAPRSRAARTAQAAGVVGRAGGAWVAHRVRRRLARAEQRPGLDRAFELRTAADVAERLGSMKGALMKIGQMASYLDHGMPEPVRAALADLQSDAPPMHPDLVAEVVRAELGGDPDDVFASWGRRPLAAASIGQVHRARTHDGREVAVKVQYPGIAEAMEADLANAGLVLGALGFALPGLEREPFVAELRARLGEELDYRHEADNQRLFADFYADHPFISVPAVLDELSTARVLTTELASGARFDEVVGWDPHERDLAGEAIYRFVFGSIYRLGAFNGDPHPGNYLFRPGGRVTFLDFGLVKRFSATEVSDLGALIEPLLVDDIAGFRAALERIGFLADGTAFRDDEVWDYFRHFFELVLREGPTTVEPDYASETLRRMFDPNGPHGEILKVANVPAPFVISQRINLGMYAILAELRATAPWQAVARELWPFVDAAPATVLGHQEAKWLARHADRLAAAAPAARDPL